MLNRNRQFILRVAFLVAGFFALFLSAQANVPGGGTGTGGNVTVTDNGGTVVLANGIVSVTIDKSNGNITNITYNGTNLLSGGHGGGYFYWDGSGGPTLATPTYTLSVNPANNGGNQAEVRLQTTASPMDMATYYDLSRGQQGIYVTMILTHQSGYADYPGAELRSNMYVGSAFDWLCVDPYRFRQMASPNDSSVSVTGAPPEVYQWTSGVYNGLTECKYAYSDPLGKLDTWGWASSSSANGIWQVLPSHEYYDGGPMHRELTEHIGNTLLNMFGGGHYGFGLTQDQPAGSFSSKTFGPAFIYVNKYGGSSSDPVSLKARTLWADAQAQAAAEQGAWPYTWFTPQTPAGMSGSAYPQANARGTVTGTMAINDPNNPGASPVSLWVGLAPDDGGVDFQQQYLTYQFWVRTGSGGSFTIPKVLPGTYNLWAFGPGAVGTFKRTNVTVTAGQTLNLGTVTWLPLRLGPTVWEIGTPDRDSNEFNNGEHSLTPYNGTLPAYAGGTPYNSPSQWGAFLAYANQYPNGVSFVAGTSNASTAWNYCQPTTPNGSGGYNGTTSKIYFNLSSAPSAAQTARLYIAFASVYSSACILTINGTVQTASVMGSTDGNYASIANATTGFFPPNHSFDCMVRLGSQGDWGDAYLDFPGSSLKAGTNEIDIGMRASGTAGNGNGFEYDYVRLELTGYSSGGTSTPTFTPTRTFTPTATKTNTATNTVANTATSTATATRTNTPMNTPTATSTNSATATRTNTVASTPTSTATATRTNTALNTPTSTATKTNTAPNTATSTATNTIQNTATNTATRTSTASATNTSVNTATSTFTNTLASTATNTATRTNTSTATNTPQNTSTNTATRTNTPSATNTSINTPTLTPTNTAMSTATSTPTNTNQSTATNTATRTNTSTATNTDVNTATSTPTNTLASTMTNTATRTNTSTGTNTPMNTPTLTPTNTAASTATQTSTNTSTATNTATVTSTNTSTMTGTTTPTGTYTITDTPSATNSTTRTNTSTATNTPTLTPSNTATLTPVNTTANTPTLTSSNTATSTATKTSTPTATNTLVNTATSTFMNTPTLTPTSTATATSTITSTNSATMTGTTTPTSTYTITDTPSATNSATKTNTLTATNTASNTTTNSATKTATSTPTSTPTQVTIQVNAGSSSNSNQLPGASNVNVLNVTMNNSSPSNVTVTNVTISVSGTGSPNGSVTLTLLLNGNLVGMATVTGNIASFNLTDNLPASGSVTYQLEASFSGSAATGTYVFSLTNAAGNNGQNVNFNGLPANGATVNIATATGSPTKTATSTATSTPSFTPTYTYTQVPTASWTPTSSSTAINTATPVPTHNVPIIYPNPAPGGTVNLLPQSYSGSSDVRVEIFTVAFRKVQDMTYHDIPSGQPVQVNLVDRHGSPLASGLYYLVVTTKTGRSIGKLMVVR